MERLVVLVVLTALGVVVAAVMQRRRPDPPSVPGYRAPAQLDRQDFDHPEKPILVVLFSSLVCDGCPRAWETIESVLSSIEQPELAARLVIQRVDIQTNPELHRRYRIDGVPTTVVADTQGVAVQSFFGPMTQGQLMEALTRAGIEV